MEIACRAGCVPTPGTAGFRASRSGDPLARGGGSDWRSPGVSGGVCKKFQTRAWAAAERAGETRPGAPGLVERRAPLPLSEMQEKIGTLREATLLGFSLPSAGGF